RPSALEVCLRMAAALSGYWEWKGYLTEGRQWLLAVLEVPMPEDPGASLLAARAKALSLAARMVFLQNEKEMAVELSEASIALWQTLDNPSGLAWALLHRSWAAHGMGEYETEKRLCSEGLSLLSPETHPWLYAQILIYLAAAHGFTSEFEQTHKCYEQSLAIFERLGDKSAIADLLKDQGGLLILEGNYAEAIDGLLRSIKLCSEMDHKQYITTGMEWLSYAVGLRKVPDPATAAIYSAQLRGFTDALMDEIGMRHWSRTLQFIQVVELHIRSFIDEPTWKTALSQGRSLKLEDAIKLVVQARNDPA
ncbi:MAG TPA: tetratricopeptide repeat protein, partial [Ktedonobacteraceae bacterium]|nr:tetratricopeptide repeat protein [Ktedonobacteraceae bacterium]